MTQGSRANSKCAWLASMMQMRGIDLPVPSCIICGCNDLRVGGREVEMFLACPKCGADGPIGRSLLIAVDKYKPHSKERE